MVADPVVGIGVDVAQMRSIELRERLVELDLVHARQPTQGAYAARTNLRARAGAVTSWAQSPAGTRPPAPAARPPIAGAGPPPPRRPPARRGGAGRPLIAGACTPPSRSARASSGSASRLSAVWPSAGSIWSAATPAASSSPARRLRLPDATTVAIRSPVPARPANVSAFAPRRRA